MLAVFFPSDKQYLVALDVLVGVSHLVGHPTDTCRPLPQCTRVPWSRWFSAKLVAIPQQTYQQLGQCAESAASRCAGSSVVHFSDGTVVFIWTRIYQKKDWM